MWLINEIGNSPAWSNLNWTNTTSNSYEIQVGYEYPPKAPKAKTPKTNVDWLKGRVREIQECWK